MSALPTHVAADDEPIPELGDRPHDGPDMRDAVPIAEMLAHLAAADDEDDYVNVWRAFVESVGGYVTSQIDKDGETHLMVGRPCDSQIRHRSRWLHLLAQDLDRIEGRRAVLHAHLQRMGRVWDERPSAPRATTQAIRDFIASGGRILLAPGGRLQVGGEMPRQFVDGSDEEARECARASRAYFDIIHRHRARAQIKRAVRLCGHRAENGWIVLKGAAA